MMVSIYTRENKPEINTNRRVAAKTRKSNYETYKKCKVDREMGHTLIPIPVLRSVDKLHYWAVGNNVRLYGAVHFGMDHGLRPDNFDNGIVFESSLTFE